VKSSFRVGDWLVEPLQNRLVRGETRVKLDPKVMQVLLYLAERPNEIAEKEKIIESVWEGTFVTDEVLTNAVFELRKAFGDDAKEPRFIQTVPRKGYRLIAPSPQSSGAPAIRKQWVGVSVALLGLGATLGSWAYLSSDRIDATELRTVPLTGFPGAEWWPALSPEGDGVAFVWNGGEPGRHDLYIQNLGASEPLRLTETPVHEFSPAWSPDGGEIAFLREKGFTAVESEVLILPSLGGAERRVSTIASVDSPGGARNPGLAWSPDGRFLAVEDRETPTDPKAIFLISLETGERRRVTFPPPTVRGDGQPAFSPDGKTLAFARLREVLEVLVYSQPLNAEEPRLLSTNEGWVTDLDWTADGSAVVFVTASEAQAGTSLWRVAASGGTPQRLPFGELAHTISIARKGARMVYDRRSWYDSDLWRVDGPAVKERGSPTRLIASSRLDWAQEYSPDGMKVAFASERSGSNNIWICESEGVGCYQLTDTLRAVNPSWSPDRKGVVFSERTEGDKSHLSIAEIEGGFTRRLTFGDHNDVTPNWSHDGRWIYFSSDRAGESQIWKIPAEGGEPIQLTRAGGLRPRESADGRFVYYADRQGPCYIRKVPVNGGAELPVMVGRTTRSGLWTLWENQIVHADYGNPTVGVYAFDLDTGHLNQLFSSETDFYVGMTVSPDGRSVLLSIGEPDTSDIMLVEGFR
jgi:Tol biopolymer transport system component/DNA-binding winged helix-turn-helix (wHTH) protein